VYTTTVSVSKREIHCLVDALPDRDARTVKQFIEFVLARSTDTGSEERQYYALTDAAPILQLTTRRLRYLAREAVIPARKVGGKWLIAAHELQRLLAPEAKEFLARPLDSDDLTHAERAYSQEGWQEYLSGDTKPLAAFVREQHNDPPK